MVIHYFDSFNEYKNLCNTKTKSKPTKNKDKITCKKCLYTLESERLLSLKSKYENEIMAQDIRGSKIF